MKPKTGNYILSSVFTALAFLFLAVLLTTKPERPPAEYWFKLVAVGIACLIGVLSFPFMTRGARIKAAPEALFKPVIVAILVIVCGFLVVVCVRAILHGQIGVVILVGLFVVGLLNVIRDVLRKPGKKRKRKGSGGSESRRDTEPPDDDNQSA